jgi:hypothetical protein
LLITKLFRKIKSFFKIKKLVSFTLKTFDKKNRLFLPKMPFKNKKTAKKNLIAPKKENTNSIEWKISQIIIKKIILKKTKTKENRKKI